MPIKAAIPYGGFKSIRVLTLPNHSTQADDEIRERSVIPESVQIEDEAITDYGY